MFTSTMRAPARLLIFSSLLLLFSLCFISSSAEATAGGVSSSDTLSSLNTLKLLSKRRRGGGGGGGGFDVEPPPDDEEEEDEDEGECLATTHSCYLTSGYNKLYDSGPGSYYSNSGGFTPDGSGEPPVWSNKTGAFVEPKLPGWDAGWPGSDGDGLYLGGAFVPYTAGETSPNGMKATAMLDFATESPDKCSDLRMDSMYGATDRYHLYRYAKDFNWSQPIECCRKDQPPDAEWVSQTFPIYCGCMVETVCGCDDYHQNDSFVEAVAHKGWTFGPFSYGELDFGRGVHGCNATVDGVESLVITGTVRNGSTKAKPNMERTEHTAEDLSSAICPSSCQGYKQEDASTMLRVSGSYIIGWVMVLTAGINHFS